MNTPNSTVNEDTYEARIKELEREKKGILGDLQSERQQRHQLEQRINQIESSLVEAAREPEPQIPADERVNRLAQEPDGYIDQRVNQLIGNRLSQIEQAQAQDRMERRFEKSYRWLAKQEKIDEEEVYGSDLENEIVRIVKENGLSSTDPFEGTRAAYKILQHERREREKTEKDRDKNISANRTENIQVPSSSGQMRFTRAGIMAMSSKEFEEHLPAIKEAERLGLIE